VKADSRHARNIDALLIDVLALLVADQPPSLRAQRSNLAPPLPYDPLDCFVASLLKRN